MELTFTGTQHGMSQLQMATVGRILWTTLPTVLHHGSCIGADAQFHELVLEFRHEHHLHVHPSAPLGHPKRAECRPGGLFTHLYTHSIEKPLKRNHIMVDAAEVVVVAPREYTEQLRSGTWATWRYARQQPRLVLVVWPNGRISDGP